MAVVEFEAFPMPLGAYPLGQVGTIGGWAITSWFGGRPNPFTGKPSWHGGFDFKAKRLTPLYSVLPGYVSQGWDVGGGGNWTTLYADDGVRLGYGHADHFEPGVNGRHVPAGAVLAYVDSTGSSTGDHLHFSMALSRYGPWQDSYDALVRCAARGLFIGTQPMPSNPLPTPDTLVPLHPLPTPGKALITLQYWKIEGDGDPNFYKVDVEPFLSPAAVDAHGQPGTAQRFVGGEYAYAFDGAAGFALDAGIGVSPNILNVGDPNHQPLIDRLRGLPLVAQAA